MTNYYFKLVANSTELDTFDDEQVLVSNNATGLFDIDKLPSDFTRELTLPASKRNNDFFKHAYDIDINTPYLFQESEKVECYIDISGYLLVQGYLQLNNINVINDKINSYDISLYGSLSNFSRDLQTNFLTDVSGLSAYNHSASYDNITDSWDGNLFGGDIVYPLIDYGKKYFYQASAMPGQFGIDTTEGCLNTQDFKPAIRVKKVLDKIFEEFGYTYTSSFFAQDMWDDIYMLCDNGKQYPIFDGVDLEGYGKVSIKPTSGSTTDIVLNTSTYTQLNFDTTDNDPSFVMGANARYNLPINSRFGGNIKLNMFISGSTTSLNGYPVLDVAIKRVSTGTTIPIGVEEINKYLRETYSQLDKIGEKTYTLEETWVIENSGVIPVADDYEWVAKYSVVNGGDFDITIAYEGNTESTITVDNVNYAADWRIMEIPQNMPYGESGITCLDFLKGLQKKYNLVIIPSKNQINEFEIETFNNWYKSGDVVDLSSFIKTDKTLKVTPANNLAVNELQFTDTLGKDYLGRNFNDLNNRIYGASTYIDNSNQFSQGKIDVTATFASSPLRYIDGTGTTGGSTAPTSYSVGITYNNSATTICNDNRFNGTAFKSTPGGIQVGDVLYWDSALTNPLRGYYVVRDNDYGGGLFLLYTSTGQVFFYYGTCSGQV
jgi:hypothetical protein